MEWFLSLFIFHDAYVVSFLVFAIALLVVLLLIFNHKSPQTVVDSELGGGQGVEEALRRVLQEKSVLNIDDDSGAINEDFEKLKEEVLDKDRTIAELNKKLTQAPTATNTSFVSGEDSEELKRKIAELEAQLQEYELIEDDIADLSTYRAENAKLKESLAQLKSQLGESAGNESTVTAAPASDESVDHAESSSDNESDEAATESNLDEDRNENETVSDSEDDQDPEVAQDLEVAENSEESEAAEASSDNSDADADASALIEEAMNQVRSIASPDGEDSSPQKLSSEKEEETETQISSSESAENETSHTASDDSIQVSEKTKEPAPPAEDLLSAFEKVVSQQEQIPRGSGEGDVSVDSGQSDAPDPLSEHPKLKDLKRDSKEEADVLIAELKSMRKGS